MLLSQIKYFSFLVYIFLVLILYLLLYSWKKDEQVDTAPKSRVGQCILLPISNRHLQQVELIFAEKTKNNLNYKSLINYLILSKFELKYWNNAT